MITKLRMIGTTIGTIHIQLTIDPFNVCQDSINPPHLGNASYYQFTRGPASFFLPDTRRYRTSVWDKSDKDPSKSMLGPEQLQHVLGCLSRAEPEGVRWENSSLACSIHQKLASQHSIWILSRKTDYSKSHMGNDTKTTQTRYRCYSVETDTNSVPLVSLLRLTRTTNGC